MKLDILAIGAHPDDIELGCGGTIIKHVDKGYKVGIIDLTSGDLGTRGTPEIRLQEAKAAFFLRGFGTFKAKKRAKKTTAKVLMS